VDKVEFTGSLSSYRTYEEWKLNKFNVQFKFQKSSYRTYEEWKRHINHLQKNSKDSSYRTYEEWKREADLKKLEEVKVLTVPMRNGNLPLCFLASPSQVQFLPYL